MEESQYISDAEELTKSSLFLLGAGATMDAGCLVSSKMLQALDESDLSNSERDAIDFLLSSLDYHASWKRRRDAKRGSETVQYSANIEDLMLLIRRIINRDSYLPYPVTGSWADKIHLLESAWQNEIDNSSLKDLIPEVGKLSLFENLQYKITSFLPKWLKFNEESLSYLEPWKNYLSKTSSSSSKVEIFSLNYDLVMESFFNSDDVSLLDNHFDRKGFSIFGSEGGAFRIRYHKLHGSLNWFKDERGMIREIPIQEYTSRQVPSPLIIFGHGNKFLSIDPFISLIYKFKENLRLKSWYFVIGYSFFDPYINNLILEGLSQDGPEKRKLIIVNPQFSMEQLKMTKEEMDSPNKEHIQRNRFVNYLESIQQSDYLSELPEFNIRDVAPEKIVIINKSAKDFYSQIFSGNLSGCSDLVKLLRGVSTNVFD